MFRQNIAGNIQKRYGVTEKQNIYFTPQTVKRNDRTTALLASG